MLGVTASIVGLGQMQADLLTGMIEAQHANPFCARYLGNRSNNVFCGL